MGTYITLDYLSAYKPTASEMTQARSMTFTTSSSGMSALGYEHEAVYYESGDYANLRELFRVNLTEGAKYYIYSSSYFDPFLLSLHDSQGAFIAVDGGTSYGNDTIYYTAPYTGTYYINASWDQGLASGHKFVYLSIAEDINTAIPSDTTAPSIVTFSPTDEALGVAIGSNIVVTFSEAIQKGNGNIVVKTADGVTVSTYDVATSGNLSISGSNLTINPTSDLAYSTGYKVEFAAGSIKDLAGNSYAGTTSYNFTTESSPYILGTLGSDTLIGGSGKTIDGFAGIDIVSYSGKHGLIAHSSNGTWTVGTDTLTNIERLQFSDIKLALDIDGNAGKVAKILTSVFGATAVSNKEYAGIGLDLIDGGMSYEALSALAINAAGAKTREAVVDLLWTNLMGSHPTAEQTRPFVDMLATDLSNVGALGVIAADYAATIGVVNLAALSQTGLEYV